LKMSNSLVPIIAKEQFDDVATAFLQKFCTEALLSPMAVPIEAIARDKMNLVVEHVNITEDLSVYGQIFFTDGMVEVYKEDTDEFIRKQVKRGTIFIDTNVFFMRNLGCERNTLAHECLHWFKHKAHHTLQSLVDGEMAVACKCPTQEKSEAKKAQWTDEDWMEWQANGIAPKILMPREMFRIKADEYFGESQKLRTVGNRETLCYEWVITSIADFFKVSRQSAEIRLKELGYSVVN
jgi:Zn-dependent peptidase ImmA (M78 family)